MNPDAVPIPTTVNQCFNRIQSPKIGLHGVNCTFRRVLEEHIRYQFWRTYQAEIQQFSPVLLSLARTRLEAVIGLRSAETSPLFLEAYLTATIEETIQCNTGLLPARERILEIGNLVSLKPGSSHLLFLVTCLLARAGDYQWLVFTATPQVQKLVKRFQVNPIALDIADGEKLGKELSLWGRYYSTKPTVMALSVAEAIAVANGSQRIKTLREGLSVNFLHLVNRLKRSIIKKGVQ